MAGAAPAWAGSQAAAETMAAMTAYPYDAPASQVLLDRGTAVTPGGVN